MAIERMFPKALTAMRELKAVTALLFPNTATKKRLAVSSLDVRIASLGTGKDT